MSQDRPSMSNLTPDELELLALDHIEKMFIEIRATCVVVHDQYRPMKLVKRHPLIATGIATAASVIIYRFLRPKPAGKDGENTVASRLFDSLLSGVKDAARRALTELVSSWLTPKSKPD
jgi:hypothetical protein